ncbi:MAG: PEP-CTERM sorting domain-containing protein [Planctomycetota bacterium]
MSDWTATVGLMAYDNTGALLAPGDVGGSNNAVPEPATAAMFAMGGALVLGARGLRRWREQRATAAAESLSS